MRIHFIYVCTTKTLFTSINFGLGMASSLYQLLLRSTIHARFFVRIAHPPIPRHTKVSVSPLPRPLTACCLYAFLFQVDTAGLLRAQRSAAKSQAAAQSLQSSSNTSSSSSSTDPDGIPSAAPISPFQRGGGKGNDEATVSPVVAPEDVRDVTVVRWPVPLYWKRAREGC